MNSGLLDWRAYLELCKPRVVALLLLTAVIGMCMSSPLLPSLSLMFLATLGIALCTSSAAAINHLIDQPFDERMNRTRNRPLPRRRLSRRRVAIFAAVLGVTGALVLLLWVNLLTAALTVAALIGYAWVYTAFLKHATSQNIVIGGLAGAAPPLLGWTAIANEVTPDALLLVMIIFAWTPPHFWALALGRQEEYAAAGIPMLPVRYGARYTCLQILFYTLLLCAASLLPYATGMSGGLYAIAALVLGAGFLLGAVALWRNCDAARAMSLFRYSIVYLALLFGLMLVDHYSTHYWFLSTAQ